MNENINLCELLSGHEGETFYSPLCGDVILKRIDDLESFPIKVSFDVRITCLTKEGRWWDNGECVLFPSKEQRDWNKWSEEQKPKVPKTWSEYLNKYKYSELTLWFDSDMDWSSISDSCSALFKIHQLIEISYGGNITNKEWKIPNYKFCIYYTDNKIKKGEFICQKQHIAFHTDAQRKEFMSYPENISLIKDFYMIRKQLKKKQKNTRRV